MFDSIINSVMIPFLQFSYNTIMPNYGVAILLLTALTKVVFYPLTQKQFKSMRDMKVIQPKLKELQKKHKDDPKKLQQEMIGLYKKHQVNPLSGCLPMLVQLPIFFAIFYTINSATFKDLLVQPGINPGFLPFWITNLAIPDPWFLLPILVGLSTWWSQKLMMTDPAQQKIMMIMPVVMTFICFKMPAGVLLYWASSQIISTVQQVLITQKLDQKGA